MQIERTGLILGLGSLVCWGCQKRPERVYVDLSRFDQINQVAPARLTLKQPVTKIERQNVLVFHSMPQLQPPPPIQENALIRAIDEQKQLSYEKLSLRFQQIAEHESTKIQQQEELALAATQAKEREISWLGNRHFFEELAYKAWPKRVRLSFLVGFPDPDPESLLAPGPSEVKHWNEAKGIRSELVTLHQNFDNQFKNAQRRIFEQHSGELRRLREELSKNAAQREYAALRKAENLIQSRPVPKDFLSLIRYTPPEATPSMARRMQLHLEQVSESSHFQQTPEKQKPASNLLQAELETWRRVKGYVLSLKLQGARDATQEFVLWRKRFQVGR